MNGAREEQFRASIVRLADDPADFLSSDLLPPFIEDLRRELLPAAAALSKQHDLMFRREDDDDLVNLLLVALIGDPEKCRYLAKNAASPFSYARTFLPIWLGIETGRRHNKVSALF